MMQKLKEEITAAANRELNRANEQFPLFTSKHEGVAVAYEELEESKEALEELETSFKCLLWQSSQTYSRLSRFNVMFGLLILPGVIYSL